MESSVWKVAQSTFFAIEEIFFRPPVLHGRGAPSGSGRMAMPVWRQGHILLHRNIVVDLSYGGMDIG
jgi:hypothetical protein